MWLFNSFFLNYNYLILQTSKANYWNFQNVGMDKVISEEK